MLDDILKQLTFKSLFKSHSDDWIDKLNHGATTKLLLVCTFVVMAKQTVGDPIHCWAPAEFKDAYVDYTKSYCWIKNTYFLPTSDTIPVDVNERREAEITYYQWIPLILLFMAFMFKFPNMVWKICSSHTGFGFKAATELMEKAYNGKKPDYKEAVGNLAYNIDMWCRTNRNYKHNVLITMRSKVPHGVCMMCSKREGTYLSALYVNVKLLYLVNIIGQFFMLNAFLGIDFGMYGFNVVDSFSNAKHLPESPRFPRITLCDFMIRQMQNIQRYTVQCVLPINLFTEKIFILLWYWLFILAILSGINLIKWFYQLMLKRNNYMFIKKYLKLELLHQPTRGYTDNLDKKTVHKFANKYLRDDGCFVLRIIGHNTSDLIVMDIVGELWKLYKADPSLRRKALGENNNTYSKDKDETKQMPFIEESLHGTKEQ